MAEVESGVILKDFQEAVENLGLLYPPDPTEVNCSIGGTVSNNASGARTFMYGPTRNYVQSLSIILLTPLTKTSFKANNCSLLTINVSIISSL